MSVFVEGYLSEVITIARDIDRAAIGRIVDVLAATRDIGGRLFILGVGGSAANASHAVNDFRKIAGIESYAPTDNVSELTARINDEGWEGALAAWLRGSKIRAGDALLVLSVGGGDLERNVSVNLIRAIETAKASGASVCAIVGRGNGYAAGAADAVVIVPCPNPDHRTPHSEAFQSVVQHLIVSHPSLKAAPTKWESVGA